VWDLVEQKWPCHSCFPNDVEKKKRNSHFWKKSIYATICEPGRDGFGSGSPDGMAAQKKKPPAEGVSCQ
jgi:hypothetical protein